MIKALFIAVALAAAGGLGHVYAQPASEPAPASGDAATPASGAPRPNSTEVKKVNPNTVGVKREELGQKLLKRKMELDNERLNTQPAKAPDRARERRQETPAADKGQKK